MKLLCLFLLLFSPVVCFSQSAPDSVKVPPPIETDRPDQTEASSVVPLGTLQVEMGFLRQVTKKGNKEMIESLYPSTLFRWGVLERLELRFIGEYQKINFKENEASTSAKGFNSFVIGTKIFITEEKGLLPQISFIGHLTIPSGASEFLPLYVSPQFRFSLSNTLSKTFSLGYNLGYEWDGDSSEGKGIYTLALGADLSQNWGAYVEVFGEKPETAKWSHSFDGGITYTPRYNIQFDVTAGVGITEEAPDYYIGAGISFRVPR